MAQKPRMKEYLDRAKPKGGCQNRVLYYSSYNVPIRAFSTINEYIEISGTQIGSKCKGMSAKIWLTQTNPKSHPSMSECSLSL